MARYGIQNAKNMTNKRSNRVYLSFDVLCCDSEVLTLRLQNSSQIGLTRNLESVVLRRMTIFCWHYESESRSVVSRGSSWPRNWTGVSCAAGRFVTSWATREAVVLRGVCKKKKPPGKQRQRVQNTDQKISGSRVLKAGMIKRISPPNKPWNAGWGKQVSGFLTSHEDGVTFTGIQCQLSWHRATDTQ